MWYVLTFISGTGSESLRTNEDTFRDNTHVAGFNHLFKVSMVENVTKLVTCCLPKGASYEYYQNRYRQIRGRARGRLLAGQRQAQSITQDPTGGEGEHGEQKAECRSLMNSSNSGKDDSKCNQNGETCIMEGDTMIEPDIECVQESSRTKLEATKDRGSRTPEVEPALSILSDESNFSEDYTRMTEVDDLDLDPSLPVAIDGEIDLNINEDDYNDDFETESFGGSEAGSISTIEADDKGDDVETLELIQVCDALVNVKINPKGDADLIDSLGKDRPVTHKPELSKLSISSPALIGADDLLSPASPPEVKLASKDDFDFEASFYEDREFDFLRTEPIRRSTSLKTYKTPPGTPRRKKAVRFADALGLDLESVRHILNADAPPSIPVSATKHLKTGLADARKTEGNRYLAACFTQPGGESDFIRRIQCQKVVLENCIVDDLDLIISGTVRVANIAFHKKVVIRYSVDKWMSHEELEGNYVPNSNDGVSDRFSFSISVPNYFCVGCRIEFAVMFMAGGSIFWDNNYGKNYVVECFARSVPTHDADHTWIHFL